MELNLLSQHFNTVTFLSQPCFSKKTLEHQQWLLALSRDTPCENYFLVSFDPHAIHTRTPYLFFCHYPFYHFCYAICLLSVSKILWSFIILVMSWLIITCQLYDFLYFSHSLSSQTCSSKSCHLDIFSLFSHDLSTQ